jgi:hypothetical protein
MPGWLATTTGYVRIDSSSGPSRDPHAYLEHLLDIYPVGPPQLRARRLIETITATGVRQVLLMVEGAGNPTVTLDNITRLGVEVIPHLRCLTAGPAQ